MNANEVNSPYLTTTEAAAYLRTTVQGIYSLVKRGRVRPMPGRRGRLTLVEPDVVRRVVDAGTRVGHGDAGRHAGEPAVARLHRQTAAGVAARSPVAARVDRRIGARRAVGGLIVRRQRDGEAVVGRADALGGAVAPVVVHDHEAPAGHRDRLGVVAGADRGGRRRRVGRHHGGTPGG